MYAKGKSVKNPQTGMMVELPGKPLGKVTVLTSFGDTPETELSYCSYEGQDIEKTLGIKALSDDAAFYLTEDTEKLLTQYAKLDDYGRHTVASVMQVEYDRCTELSKPEVPGGSVNSR